VLLPREARQTQHSEHIHIDGRHPPSMPIASIAPSTTCGSAAGWRDFMELTKPKVSLLIVFTAIVGMVLASPGMVPLRVLVFGTLGIAMASGSAAALNHILDRRIDIQMARTRRRPLPSARLRTSQALVFAIFLGVASMLVLWRSVGSLCALLTLGSLIGYAIIYTGWLKRSTPQNIVIGGAAGAAPPLLGWVAVTHSIDVQALILFLIVFSWTPPHFWSLAIARRDEYAQVGIPMLPVTHGIPHTRLQILLYTILLILCTMMPVLVRTSGLIYLAAALLLDARMLYLAVALYRGVRPELPMRTFRFSITYLMALFGAFIVDHYFNLPL
jgi:protoheme IX farnesyltransferase